MTRHAEKNNHPIAVVGAPRRVFQLLITLLISSQLVGCGWFVKRPTEDKNPLLAVECPAELPTLTDATLGEHTKKSLMWLNQYHNCRKAALTGAK